jgi:hypothetical protein
MDADTPRRKDDLSEVERRLAGWRPGAEGLDADAMLFAAGLAAGRRGWGRFLGPGLCVLLTALAVGLGAWGLSEHAERQALANRLRERAPAPGGPPAAAVAAIPEPAEEPSPGDYLSLRRRMEQDPAGWLASPQSAGPAALGAPPPGPAVLRLGQGDRVFDP